jgi:hypothetical protein
VAEGGLGEDAADPHQIGGPLMAAVEVHHVVTGRADGPVVVLSNSLRYDEQPAVSPRGAQAAIAKHIDEPKYERRELTVA